MTDEERILLGVADVSEANRIKTELARHEVDIKLAHNPQTCSTGCTPTVEVWAREQDLPKIEVFFREQREKLFAGLKFDPELVNQTFDVEKEEATCPACSTTFSTKLRECPDCGLVFSLPEDAPE